MQSAVTTTRETVIVYFGTIETETAAIQTMLWKMSSCYWDRHWCHCYESIETEID